MSEWKKYLTVMFLTLGFAIGVEKIQHQDSSFWGFIVLGACIYIIIDVLPKQNIKQHLCYKLRIRITPKWEEIVPHVPKDVKYPEQFWKKVVDDTELGINKEYSLIGKSFSYTVFVNESSGMKQFYNNDTKTFDDKLEISGEIFNIDNPKKLTEKYGIPENISNIELEITPDGIGKLTRDSILPYYTEVKEGNYLSIVPFYEIVNHLKKLFFVWGSPMSGILKFPDELQKQLDEHKIKYETRDFIDTFGEWYGQKNSEEAQKHTQKAGFILSNDRMSWHTFSAKHFEVSLNLERLKPGDINSDF